MDSIKTRAGSLALAMVLFTTPVLGTACSGRHVHRQETTETVTSDAGAGAVTTERTETEEEHESSGSSCSGVLSCAVHAVGEVLAFPFRAVGYIFQALF